jgi:hypothetical protein
MRQIYRRNPWNLEIQYQSGNSFIDLSNYTLTFIVKKTVDNSQNDSDAIIKKVVTIPSNAGNTYIFSLTSEDTNVKAGTYNTEFQLSKTIGLETTYITMEQNQLTIIDTFIKE